MAAGVESLLVKVSPSVPLDLLSESNQNRNKEAFYHSSVVHALTGRPTITPNYLSDSSKAGQRPQAAAVCDDHGLRQQAGRMVLW